MGCGISKFDQEEKSLTCELITPLRQTNVHPFDQDVGSPANYHGHNSCSWPARVDNIGVVKEPAAKEIIKMKLLEHADDQKENTMEKEVEILEKEESLHKEEVEEEKLLYDGREDSLIGPGSPSFREYCIASASGDSNINGIGDGVKREKMSSMEGSLNPDKGSRTQFAKKERKIRGFRSTILAKGRSLRRSSKN